MILRVSGLTWPGKNLSQRAFLINNVSFKIGVNETVMNYQELTREQLREKCLKLEAELEALKKEMGETRAALSIDVERFQVAARTASDLIYEWVVGDDILLWFGDIDQALGFGPGEIPRNIEGWVSLIHPDDQASLAGSIERHRTVTVPIDEEYRIRTKDGAWRHWTDRGVPILDEQGRPVKWIGVCADITERRQAEKSLRESEERCRYLAEGAMEAIFINKEGICLEANQAAADMFGYESTEAIKGIFGTDVIAPESHELVRAHMLTNSSEPYDAVGRHKNGATFPVSIKAKTMNYKDEGPVRVTIVRDITGRKRAEEEKAHLEAQLRQSQKIEAIGNLASGVAHDINNMLAAVMGLASILQMDIDPDDPSQEEVEGILSACNKGHELTRNLLGFARKGRIRKERVSLNRLIGELVNLLKRTISKQIDLEIRLKKELALVEGDPGQLNQLLFNLALNASDAMAGRGALLISTEEVVLDERAVSVYRDIRPGPFVRLRVRDTGAGMDEETREHAFEPFFTTKPVGKGTGLGLSMVYGMVKNHGGFVQLDSKKGRGTMVTVYLPALDSREREPALPRPKQLATLENGGTILLVDDEAFVRNSGRRLLGRLGFTVLTAENGQEALDLYAARQEEIRLVLLDLIMPVMAGEEAFTRLKQFDPSVRILLSSGYSREGMAEKLLARGALGFLSKPYNMEQLSAELSRTLG